MRSPADPPSEFQRLVETSSGLVLPLYGASLFKDVPTTFAPLDSVPVTPEYVVGPGDELLIQVWGQVTLNSHSVVDRSGNIYIPQVGTVSVAGLHFAQLGPYVKSQLGKVFRNFDLNVNLGQLRSIQILVLGQAMRPGSYTVSSLSSLVDALFVTGGPKSQGSLRHVELIRAGKLAVDFDLYDLLLRGNKTKDIQLLPGDIIFIPPVGPQVAVAGSVTNPAIYELDPNSESTVKTLLDLAAGPNVVASTANMRLERIDGQNLRSVTQLALDGTGLATKVRGGDILELAAVTDRYRDGITLRGNVANPGRYGWKPGMRVSDLFPDKDALITRDYWLKRGQLGVPILSYAPFCPTNSPKFSNGESSTTSRLITKEILPSDCVPSSANSKASDQGEYRILDQQKNAAGPLESTGGGFASVASATVGAEDIEKVKKNTITLAAPDIDWSYAVVERQDKETLSTSLIPFNLGRLVLDRDAAQNIELQPSDVVTIFSKEDIRVPQSQQTRYVHLEGEVASAGVYSVFPGETLPQLIKRAGGITSDAYLYGSEFTRISTQRLQQKRLNEYIDQISIQASANSVSAAGRNISVVDTAAAAAMQSQNQNIISALRRARASGRIVLNLKPGTSAVDDLPPLSLEDGDTFIVPAKFSTVAVSGAVYSANTFLYEPNLRVGDYLRLAGGANHDADAKRSYVIRADGSVVSKQQISPLRKDGFDSLSIYRGDTIIVPLNLNKGATLRNIVDISQIFGQFGIALAAANVIF